MRYSRVTKVTINEGGNVMEERVIHEGFDFVIDELEKNPNAEIVYYETLEDYLADVIAEDWQELVELAEKRTNCTY